MIAEAALDLFRRLEDYRPVRLLGVRAEMVPPEGGYDPPRTHGRRRANPCDPPRASMGVRQSTR